MTQIYLVQASYTDNKEIMDKVILVAYQNESSANRTADMLQRTFKSSSKTIKAEYTVLAFEVL